MKYDHDVIRDLIPLCVDGIASEKSEAIVREHIAECEECAAEWKQMQQGEPAQSEAAVPTDEARFQKTAKRVRRRKRLAVCTTVCSVILAGFGLLLLANAPTIHFTLKGTARAFVRDCSADLYETPEQYRGGKSPEITYLGTVKSADGQAAAAYTVAKLKNLDFPVFSVCTAERFAPLLPGIWDDVNGEFGAYITDTGVFSSYNIAPYQEYTKCFWTAGFYSNDPAVKMIHVTANGKEETLTLNNQHFAGFQISGTEDAAEEKAPTEILTEGEALDQNGNVLYRLKTVENSVPSSGTYQNMIWVRA